MLNLRLAMRSVGLLVLLLSACLLLLAAPTVAYTPASHGQGSIPVRAYLSVNGEKLISHDTQDGAIETLYFENGVKSPRDASSGMATGRRQHQPLVIRKRVDNSTPLLIKALTQNANVEAKFDFRKVMHDGTEQVYYWVRLHGARVVDYQMEHSADGDLEKISFTFQRIEWTYTDGGVTHEDTWDAQR